MTLRSRLLLSALVLSFATTLALGLVVRSSWQNSEAHRFHAEFDSALAQLTLDLRNAGPDLAATLKPLCDHDPIVDSALIGLRGGSMDERLLSVRTRVPELKKSLGLSELSLITSEGEVLAGDPPSQQLTPAEIAAHVVSVVDAPQFRAQETPAFEAACRKGTKRQWVALLAGTHVEQFLKQAGAESQLKLFIKSDTESLKDDDSLHREQRQLASLGGAELVAERSRKSLRANLEHLDSEVLTAAGLSLAGAFLLALFLSRGLARPVVRFAELTRQAVQGKVQELEVSGGPELEQAARAFNATLADLAALREQLRATEKIAARREVARQIAHEIKNPLSPIRTSIETLRKLKERGHEEFDSYFEETTKTVLGEVQRISTLVGHFAEYARLPSPSPAETDLVGLTAHLAQIHEGLGATIDWEPTALPPILADQDQISQVLTNLIKNAIEATTDQKDAKVTLRVFQDPSRNLVKVDVSDNGPGLPPERLAEIFEPYVTTKKEGTGLGLPISHRIAIEHGGDLTYTTSASGGACFTLTLPVHGPPSLSPDRSRVS